MDATVFASSDDFIRWDVPDDVETVLARVGTGDRLIIAFTREIVIAALEVGGTATMPGLTASGGVRLRAPSTGDQNLRLGDETPDVLYLGG